MLYMSLLSEKMNRFRKSGVTKIGRMPAGRDERFRKTPDLENEMGEEVLRDTRVVWAQYSEGGPRELRYEQLDGERVHSILHPGGEHHPRKGLPTFGPAKPLTKESELGRPVPTEFQSAALSRHQQVWGVGPETIRVRAPYWGFFERGVEGVKNRKPAPPQSKPGPTHDDPINGPFVDALPVGMPVAQSKKEPT
jgi:hypothetical protein